MALYLYVPFKSEFVRGMADHWKQTAATHQHKDYEIIQYGGKANAANLKGIAKGDTVYILCHGDPKGMRFVDRARADEGTPEALSAELLAKRIYEDGLKNVEARIKLYACEANTGEDMLNIALRFSAAMVGGALLHLKTPTPKFSIFGYSRSVSNPMKDGSDGEVHKRAVQVKEDDETFIVLGRASAFRSQLYP